jgi:hypothetical protein
MDTFDPACLQGHNLIYFKLHGMPEQPYWYGDNWHTAISAEQIRSISLAGATVFVANCFLSPGSPMLEALLAAGPAAVIGGDGENYARADTIDGADALGLFIRIWLERGFAPRRAFRFAKGILRFISSRPAVEDALRFDFFQPPSPLHSLQGEGVEGERAGEPAPSLP